MKKAMLVLVCVLTACVEQHRHNVAAPVYPVAPVVVQKFKDVTYYKFIKDLKEVQEQHTSYGYQLDPLGRDLFKLMPEISTKTKYYIVYTDHTHDEVGRNEWLNYSVGDSIAFTKRIPA